jgi:hypothetical protein
VGLTLELLGAEVETEELISHGREIGEVEREWIEKEEEVHRALRDGIRSCS